MMKMTFPILMVATLGCASEVELPLDLDRGVEPPPDMEPDSPADPPPDPPPDPPLANDWSRTDFPPVQGEIQDLVWTTDGSVVAATPSTADLDSAPEWAPVTLTRYGADGATEWVAHASPTDRFIGLAAIDGGGVVVGIWPDATSSSPAPAGLEWYDAEGNLTASWRPSAEETGEQLASISSFRPLPDGGVFWVGRAGLFDAAPVAGLLDAQRQLQWIVPLSVPAGSYMSEQDVAVTADGVFAVLARYTTEQPEEPDSLPSSRTFVFQLGPDGGERWRTELAGHVGAAGIRVASSGNLVVVGAFDETMSVGDLVLEGGDFYARQFVAEIDPAGVARGLHLIELPAWFVDSGSLVDLRSMTVAGEELVIAEEYMLPGATPLIPGGLLSTTHRLDGTLVSETSFARQAVAGNGPTASAIVIDVAADGRRAVGGLWGGSVDFGDGVVESGVSEWGFSLGRPFVTVFEPSGAEVD